MIIHGQHTSKKWMVRIAFLKSNGSVIGDEARIFAARH
jgi:hypothetical protein